MKLSEKYLPIALALTSLTGCAKQPDTQTLWAGRQQEIIDRHNEAGIKAHEIIAETKKDLENAVNTSYDYESIARARLSVINNPDNNGKLFYTNGKAVRDPVSTLCIEQSTGYDNSACDIPVGTEVTIIGSIDINDGKEYIFRANKPDTVYFPMGEASVKRFISCGENPSQNEKHYVCRFMPKE